MVWVCCNISLSEFLLCMIFSSSRLRRCYCCVFSRVQELCCCCWVFGDWEPSAMTTNLSRTYFAGESFRINSAVYPAFLFVNYNVPCRILHGLQQRSVGIVSKKSPQRSLPSEIPNCLQKWLLAAKIESLMDNMKSALRMDHFYRTHRTYLFLSSGCSL